MKKIVKILNLAGYETVIGKKTILKAIKSISSKSNVKLCSGYGVFPNGKRCQGCSDCKKENKMCKIRYSIGTDPMAKKDNVKLHLWREEKSQIWKVASFPNHTVAEAFAKDFGFPLADHVKKILNSAQITGQDGD